MVDESRESLLEFLPNNTKLWLKDLNLTLDTIDKYYEYAAQNFNQVLFASNYTQVVLSPEDLFETSDSFQDSMKKLRKIEFGNRFSDVEGFEFDLHAAPQPSFHKNF